MEAARRVHPLLLQVLPRLRARCVTHHPLSPLASLSRAVRAALHDTDSMQN